MPNIHALNIRCLVAFLLRSTLVLVAGPEDTVSATRALANRMSAPASQHLFACLQEPTGPAISSMLGNSSWGTKKSIDVFKTNSLLIPKFGRANLG